MKTCPYCKSKKIIVFDADNDMCTKCNRWFSAVLENKDIKKKDKTCPYCHSTNIIYNYYGNNVSDYCKNCNAIFPIDIIVKKTQFQKLQDELGQWADKTFGPRTPESLLHHLKEEVEELMESIHDESEWADCLTLLIDSYRLATGKNTNDLLNACFEKLEVNKQRTWNEPDHNGVVRHIK